MRVLKNPVAQFLAAGIVVVFAVALVSDVLSRRAAAQEAIADARAMTEILAHAVVEPEIPFGLVYGSRTSAAIFDDIIAPKLVLDDVERIKVWNAEGWVVWSDQPGLIGTQFDLSGTAQAVLGSGRPDGEVTDLRRPENVYEVEDNGLLEVYTRIESPEGEPLLFEVYYAEDDLAATTSLVLDAFRPITVGGALLVGLLTVPLLWGLDRRLRRASAAREKLLRAAVHASEEERRRIARDLHDAVGHRLGDVADALTAEALDETVPPAIAGRLRRVDDEVRASVEVLRSLVIDVYPPDLDASRLSDALDDLVLPAAEAGLDVRVDVEDLGPTSDDVVALVWRVAREGVRNTLRHARGTSLRLTVRRSYEALELRVADDGVGFVPGAFARSDRLGLRGLGDLVAESGGRLSVSSGPGRGTVLTLEVPTR